MSSTLHRRDVVGALLAQRGDALVVAGLGSTAWDCTAAGDSPLTFPLWGAMGTAAMVGLGLAIAQPARRVLVITGDGEMLMGLGSLATIGVPGAAQPGDRSDRQRALRRNRNAGDPTRHMASISRRSRSAAALPVRASFAKRRNSMPHARASSQGSGPTLVSVQGNRGEACAGSPPA
jgi:hypothetical protein